MNELRVRAHAIAKLKLFEKEELLEKLESIKQKIENNGKENDRQ
jgi:hypothetical protein